MLLALNAYIRNVKATLTLSGQWQRPLNRILCRLALPRGLGRNGTVTPCYDHCMPNDGWSDCGGQLVESALGVNFYTSVTAESYPTGSIRWL